ncbi:MAG: heme-binding protein [Candidatus Thiodiazotropha lotti]|uniref:Cobalamin adenosyltransferase n=1 Tax=Candidatus Thiodiazotropha endoloripes TaxID=1818881 RepID=A0A1E2UPQ3_9GAMM|nr:heme-binding protein [Candidatus Thiodiazotropha endoloripes]MCG7899496.1 heme-binding protein [Candidatus Thiodiazotropha weberae]MCG7993736.1 heme-binding protein [Candidatus Thiodiazotropha lotti]MCG7902452.1 heme-binding protein [Candidatus Thiodiazotropha weberae]MCG7912907.1 heme-binding protein [Candidatus Thiodiazotropha weberae]MCG8000811.1 heme-binding protein [Candidatus Thiodiazotropha lotti]
MELAVNEPQIHWRAAADAVTAAVQQAEEMGIKINAAVVDKGGNLLAFQRMNGAFLHSIGISIDKAYTAAGFGFPTRKWMDEIRDIPQLREGIVHRDRLVIFGGGLPIVSNDQVIGAIGVSGGSEEQDEICARAGLQRLGL